jgi:hypothetical protein
MGLLFHLVDEVDTLLLYLTIVSLRFLEDWLWSRRWIERCMIAGYLFPYLAWVRGVCSFNRAFRPYLPLAFLVLAFVSSGMWAQHRLGDSERIARMSDRTAIGFRVFMAGWALVLCWLSTRPPHHWFDVLQPLGFASYTIFQYAAVWPGGGQPGRRRKLAWAKLKEIFGESGVSWLPAPEHN